MSAHESPRTPKLGDPSPEIPWRWKYPSVRIASVLSEDLPDARRRHEGKTYWGGGVAFPDTWGLSSGTRAVLGRAWNKPAAEVDPPAVRPSSAG